MTNKLVLLPMPQHLHRLEGSQRLQPEREAIVHVDPAQAPRPEGYRLSISEDGIHIVAHDAAGAFYAAMAMRQIARQSAGAGELPCLRIEDWPDFPHRGVMLDISRDKVPTMETLYALVDLLADRRRHDR